MRLLLTLTASASIASPLLADAAAPDTAPEIVVTGLPIAKGDTAYDIVSLGHDQLATSASNRIEDVLRDVAGFQQYRRTDSRTANPTSQGATLRSLGGNASSRALVTLDGAPVADPFAGYIPWFALAPERLGNVRVTRGAGAGAFGSGALAGTIELSSADSATLPGMQAELDFGSRNSLTASAVGSTTLGTGAVSLFGRYDRGDGYVIIPANQAGPADIPARYAQGSLGFDASIPVGDETKLLVDALGFEDHRVRGIDGNTSAVRGVDTSIRLLGTGRWQWQALAYLQAQTFANDVVALDAARAVAIPSLDQYNTPATGFGGKLELRPPIGDGIELRLGVDLRDDTGQTEERSRYLLGRYTRLREGGGHNQVAGGYAEVSVTPLEDITLTAGGRIDHWRIAGGFLHEIDAQTFATTIDERPADRDGWEPTGRGGIAWDAVAGLKLRAAAYLGYRLPTLNELYRPFRVGADATASNSALGLERLKGAEVGADFHPSSTVRLGITAFTNRLEGAIGNVTAGVGPGTYPEVGFVAAGGIYRVRRNLDAIVAQGIEAEAHLTEGAWRLDASYAYTHARVRGSGLAAALNGLPPALTPSHQASATVGWVPWPNALVALTGRYSGAQNEDDLGTRRLSDAATLDAVIDVPVARGIVVTLRGENLTDALIQSGESTTGIIDRGTPRTLTVGLRFSR
ncbi:TonB-dependent receptor [Polymorphobacter sp. PAMC 29334]|uniref:TonB-dependent receptor n=1 Tax=Polymorphobacter sp. PAMC 29334 TaxID=2862331 RepID=UPI001C7483DC|nr:TonB-dependent receptor [Polymorphobacter sp. PAMC 29334]QYE36606.1 TonB-dependent receptor [Polymorphobacter sp. PAMC 29334]